MNLLGQHPASIELATLMALDLFEEVFLGSQPGTATLADRLSWISDLRAHGQQLSTGEEALTKLVLAVWNGSQPFGVAELSALDAANRRQALDVLTTWVEATT